MSSPPDRSSAFLAATFWPQYHCTSPMWWARSRTDHSGHDGTRVSRSMAPTMSESRRLWDAMASSLRSKPKPRRRRPRRPGVPAHGAFISSSPPTYGASASGSSTVPSSWRPFSISAAQIRGQASAEPFTVCTSCRGPPPAGR